MSEQEEFEFRLRLESEQSAKPTRGELFKRELMTSPPMAVARGIKDVIDTGAGFLSRLGGADEQARVRAADAAGRAEFDKNAEGRIVPQIGRFMGNMATVAPIITKAGGAIATVAPRLGAAVTSGGMSTGAAPVGALARAGDMGIRMAGGAAGGFAGAGMVDPSSAGTGAAIGAAFPPLVALGGKLGGAVGGAFRSRDAKTGAELGRALDLQDPQALAAAVQALRQAPELVPGARPTVAQALQTPQAGILERVVSDSAGGAALKNVQQAQNAARLAALDGVAPVNPLGMRTAQQETGEAVGQFAQAARTKAKAATRAAYDSVPQDEAALYLPDLAAVRNQYFGAGSFTNRGGADAAVKTAGEIGTMQAPGIVPTKAGAQPKTLAQAVRSAGGLNLSRNEGRAGELVGLRGDMKNLVFNRSGLTPNRMAERMHEAGYIPENSIDSLIDALKNDARSGPQYSTRDLPEQAWMAAREAEMGAPPGAEAIPKKVTLREFDNLRKSIGQVQRGAAADPERATEAAALSKMKQTLDDRINEVVRGDGKADEVLPIAWADALDQARKLKLDEVQRFMTGPQAAIFRRGSDGQPLVQGGEVAAKFWGNRPGLSDDVKSFKRLIGDNPRLLGQFQSMVTTEGAATATNAGNMTGKFARWVENSLPGLKEAFSPEQVRTLQRIAQDVKRAEAAAAAGMSRGSNTYQNAQNALNLGLLDNPMVSAAAGRMPLGIGGAFDWMKTAAKDGKARRLAGVLSDSELAANALMLQQAPRGKMANALMNPELQRALLRAAPLSSTDR